MRRRFARLLVALAVFFILAADETASGEGLSSGPHIADVNILLPPRMTRPVEYLLQGSGGCFKWSWDHHDLLAVLPEYNSTSRCSTSARVRSIAPYSGRKEASLYATDANTGVVIRCKVFIDNISKIRISHNSVKLDLDGLATLRVRAYDDQDNEFSSLVGLQFLWQLLPETDESLHHLVHVPLNDSPLSDCGGLCGDLNIQVKLEESGVFSNLFVVKGVGIGREKVSVNLLEPGFKHLADMIDLTVAEAMSLDPPSPVFVLVGASLQYTLKVIRGNLPQVVALPSAHHRWHVANSSVAEVDTVMGLAHTLRIGETAVVVEDTRVSANLQESSLNVVSPESLNLHILPLSNSGDLVEGTKAISSAARWYVVSGHQYLIQMKVFSSGPDAHEIYITESDDLRLDDANSECWKTYLPSNDMVVKHGLGESRILLAALQGTGRLKASLNFFYEEEERRKVLIAEQEVSVCDPVKFSFDKRSGNYEAIKLPWAPAIYQEVTLAATGGCGKAPSDYGWIASDMSILTISDSGVVQAKKPGKSTVKVVSVFDPLNYDKVVIEVSVPSSMIMLQNFPVETVIGSHLQAAVTMTAPNGAHFYACDAFHPFVKWMTGSEIFVVVNSTKESHVLENPGTDSFHLSLPGPPCSWTRLYALGSGQTILQATLSKDYYHVDHSLSMPILLKASLPVASYPPLVVHQAGDGNQFGGYSCDVACGEESNETENLEELYLSPGATMDVMYLGGPQPWGKGVDFIESVELFDDQLALISDERIVQPVTGVHRSVYRVSCSTLGTFNLVFKRGNLVGEDHPLPAVSAVTLAIACSFPSSIAMIIDEPENTQEVIGMATLSGYSAGHIRATPVTVANGQTIRIAAVGIDVSGKAYANSSSLHLKWELTGCSGLALWDDVTESRITKSSWERYLALLNESGECIVRASFSGFVETIGARYLSHVQSLDNILSGAIRLKVVTALKVNPEFTLLFLDPDAKASLSVSGGSCFWEASANDSQVVDVIQPPPSLQCSQLVLSPKGLGKTVVTIYDIGLVPPMAVSAMVQVADVDWIKISSTDEIILMEGQAESIDLIAGTVGGSTFDPSQLAFMKIQVHIEDYIIDLAENYDSIRPGAGYLDGPNFKLIAKHIGVTTIYVSARQHSGHEVVSQTIKVEVYAPLRIHPGSIFLAPGASYTLTVEGGPTIGAYVNYASLDEEIATADGASGKLSAMSPGNTIIVSRVYSGGGTMICEAFGTVKVGVPTSVKLHAQSEQLDVGREMPIYLMFAQGCLFSYHGLCKSYNWTIEDQEVISFSKADDLHGYKHHNILMDEKEFGFYQIFRGRSAGRTRVAVTFLCDFVSPLYSQSRLYEASLSLVVVAGLPLALGGPMTWILPPYYTSSSLLPSSLRLHGEADSRKGTVHYSLLKTCGEHGVWQHDAIQVDGERIKTFESGNLACIQAKDRVTGRVEVASCVRVAEVAQIRITSEFPHQMINLAVGAQIDLPISYYDALGNPFFEAHNAVYYDAETNYPDIVTVDYMRNGSNVLHLKGKRPGQALVRVLISGNPEKSDYMLISVGAHLLPQGPVLQQGSSLSFSLEGIDDQVPGRWYSANESVISVHMPSGKAEAVGVGSTQVFYESSSTRLQTAVTVLPGSIISIDAPKEILTNIRDPVEGYRFSVKISASGDWPSSCILSNYCSDSYGGFVDAPKEKAVSFHCKVEPDFIGYAKPWKDLATGDFYCLFSPYSPEHLVHSLPKSKGMRPYLSISITATLRASNSTSSAASSLFIGGFSMTETDQLNLTSDLDRTTLNILGNTDVVVHWNERSSLIVRPIDQEDLGLGGRIKYEVKVLKDKKLYPFKDTIVFTLPATGQKYEVDVNFEPPTASKALQSDTLWSTILILALLLAFGILALVFMLRIPDGSHITASSATVRAPVTPVRSCPPPTSESSPRTPEPFVEYLRQTIDETPFYRRDSRRRFFNPQNTY